MIVDYVNHTRSLIFAFDFLKYPAMRGKLIITVTLLVLGLSAVYAQTGDKPAYTDSLNYNLQLIKRYISHGSKWHFTDPLAERRLAGMIDFIENEPIDTILNHFSRLRGEETTPMIVRKPQDAPDSLRVAGYIPLRMLNRQLEAIEEEVKKEYEGRPVTVPEELMQEAEENAQLIPPGEGMQLITEGIYTLPDSLKVLDAIPEEMVQSPQDFRRILRLDNDRSRLVEQMRIHYNDSVLSEVRNNRIAEYRRQLIEERANLLKSQRITTVKRNNEQVMNFHNKLVIDAVNDSIYQSIRWLTGFANLVDNTTVNLMNLTYASSPLVLSNAGKYFTRVWLKNQQNDSLSVLVQNIDRRSMQLVIEDGVTFSRFRQQAVKDFDFTTLNKPSTNLDKVSKRYQAYTPWSIGGNGNTGFTQTYLSNWKKGGKSALSILIVARGFANYSSDKVKWENSGEIRNGWINPGQEGIKKNDDKFGLTSRLGFSAGKKWYYSTEVDLESQFFYGYKYPNRDNPISGFLAPGRFLFKIGMDYKPNKDLSLFISPLTSKLVFVNDTLKIDKSNFGITPGKSSYWEPGLNTDLKFKKDLFPNVTFETKFRMFVNYLAPFKQLDVDWENLLNMQLTHHISINMMVHSIYDSKILFEKTDKEGNPVLDSQGNKVRGPKLQFKEFITVGFSYKINRRVLRAREIFPD